MKLYCSGRDRGPNDGEFLCRLRRGEVLHLLDYVTCASLACCSRRFAGALQQTVTTDMTKLRPTVSQWLWRRQLHCSQAFGSLGLPQSASSDEEAARLRPESLVVTCSGQLLFSTRHFRQLRRARQLCTLRLRRQQGASLSHDELLTASRAIGQACVLLD